MISIKKALSFLTNNNYSSSEIKTGKKWIDGKPIYRRTYSFVPKTQAREWEKFADLPENISTAVNLYGVVREAGGDVKPATFTEVDSSGLVGGYGSLLFYNNHGLYYRYLGQTATFVATVEYTKTADVGGGVQ